MTVQCPRCGKDFENTKALGSHIHYVHENENLVSASQNRSENEKERFGILLKSCLTDKDLPKLRNVDKIEQAIVEIPEGVSSMIDQYRDAYRCAVSKEKLIKEIEEELIRESSSEETS